MYSVGIKSLFAVLLLSYGLLIGVYAADDNMLNQSNKVFDLAEKDYSQFFSPSGVETFELDDYWVRYYSTTDTYIGTLGDKVYVYGKIFNGLLYVGNISDFIVLGSCTDNFPKPACDSIKGSGARIHFVSGQSCSSAFPEYEYDPKPSEGSEQVCGLGFIDCGACGVDY